MKVTTRHPLVPLLGALATLGLVACDSGGDDEPSEPVATGVPTPDPSGDTTPPQVIAVAPLDGAIEIPPDVVLRAVFDEDMFAPSLDATSVVVTDAEGATVAGEVVFDASDNSVSFAPDAPLDMALGNRYTASLADTITDLSGNALEPVDWSFAAMEHDCTPYAASTNTERFGGQWRPAGLFRESWEYQSATTPAEPGGGYYRLRLTTEHPDGSEFAGPNIIAEQGEGTNILFSGDARSVYETVIGVIPGAVYDFTLYNGWAVTDAQPPVTWEFERTYVGVMDCYEPNDQLAFADAVPTARKIPLNLTLEAYAKPGFENSSVINSSPSFHDWYRIVLTESSDISLEIVSTPSDTALRSRLFDDGGVVLLDSEGVNVGAGDTVPRPYRGESRTLDAGTYYLHVYPAAIIPNWKPIISDGDPITDAYVTPYRFRVNAEATQ